MFCSQIGLFLNLVKLNLIWIVIELFRVFWRRTNFRLVTNRSDRCSFQDSEIDLSVCIVDVCSGFPC